MKLVSHTLVKNGMPFIKLVLEVALPLVDRMLITISVRSTDGSWEAIKALNSPKIEVFRERVANPGELTQERQKLVDKTDPGDIIWFLDDDDYWEVAEATACVAWLNTHDLDAVSVNPYQLLSATTQDARWVNKKYFTKFFKNVGINYRQPWPRDLIYKNEELLYHKTNPRNQTLPHKFFHLAAVKPQSFRKTDLPQFNDLIGRPVPLGVVLPEPLREFLSAP